MDRKKKFQQICWYAESGIHSSNSMIHAFQSQWSYYDSILEQTIQSLFRAFAEERMACLQILELPFDYVIYPIVEPHFIAHFLKRSINNYTGVLPKEKQRVRFTVWDGNNAPSQLEEWTGEVLRKIHNRSFVEYIIKRDYDYETIKLARGYIREVVQ